MSSCFFCKYTIPHFFPERKVVISDERQDFKIHKAELNYCPFCGRDLREEAKNENKS